MPQNHPSEVLRSLKVAPPEKLRAEGRTAMVRFSEQQFAAEKKRIAERKKRLDPIYTELAAVVRKAPELAGVVRAIDARDREHRPSELPAAKKNPFAPTSPLVRLGSIQIVDSLPFYSDTWLGQDGTSNNIFIPPTADGSAGYMEFAMQPGVSSSGHCSCWAAVGATVAIPNSNGSLIVFSANPWVNWWYSESSTWWREAAGNMWVGLYVGIYDAEGSFLGTLVNMQNSVASFDDRNLSGHGDDSGSNPVMPLVAIAPILGNDVFVQYWCWIGGSCNADGDNSQSWCWIQMNANCSSLAVNIIGF